jgi:ribosome-binding protein aMBF1 (putative translation factor)
MKTPNSTLELSDAIESLVASYMESVRETAEQAVARALVSRDASRRRSSPATRTTSATSRSTPARRTATELEQVCDTLCERVRAQPGASMVELAEQMGANPAVVRAASSGA